MVLDTMDMLVWDTMDMLVLDTMGMLVLDILAMVMVLAMVITMESVQPRWCNTFSCHCSDSKEIHTAIENHEIVIKEQIMFPKNVVLLPSSDQAPASLSFSCILNFMTPKSIF